MMATNTEAAIERLFPYFKARVDQGESVEAATLGAIEDVRRLCEDMISNKTDSSRAARNILCWQVFALANGAGLALP